MQAKLSIKDALNAKLSVDLVNEKEYALKVWGEYTAETAIFTQLRQLASRRVIAAENEDPNIIEKFEPLMRRPEKVVTCVAIVDGFLATAESGGLPAFRMNRLDWTVDAERRVLEEGLGRLTGPESRSLGEKRMFVDPESRFCQWSLVGTAGVVSYGLTRISPYIQVVWVPLAKVKDLSSTDRASVTFQIKRWAGAQSDGCELG